ncbi:MAG: hypothetical protein A2Y61_02295 [Chloroflexi bacterium RBG_13_60_13]|nr:MAG: hypothetical protein A2Y61_02295 [Chloroflexi bacterium RBG_13_60_13]
MQSSGLGKVAYSLDGEVYVKALPDGEPQRVLADGVSYVPRWSPSGEWLLFQRGSTYWVMRSDGSDQHKVRGFLAAWAPRDDRLAYRSDGGPVAVEKADGSDRRELTVPDGTLMGLSWSPDGRWLAYVEEIRNDSPFGRYAKLGVIGADGGGDSVDLYESTDSGIVLAGWSPDGRYVLFWLAMQFSGSLMADGLPLQSIPASGGELRELIRGLVGSEMWSAAPGGETIAMTDGGGREAWTGKRIAVVDVATGDVSELTGPEMASVAPSWSADGTRIAFVSQPDRGPDVGMGSGGFAPALRDRRIWVMGADGSDKRQLTDDPQYRDESPLWSRDGSQILFARLDAEGQASLWLVPSGGGDPRLVVGALGLSDEGPLDYYGSIGWDGIFDWWRGP